LVAEEEEEGSGDGPLSREVDESNRGWEFQINNKESPKNVEDSFEFGHDHRRFHFGYP
jgi:hypothetical protein